MTKFTETLIFFLENWFHVIKNIYFLQSRVQENFRLLLKLQWVFQLTRQNLFIISNWNEKLSLRQAIAYEKNQQYSYSFKKCLAFMRTFNFNKQNKKCCMYVSVAMIIFPHVYVFLFQCSHFSVSWFCAFASSVKY